MKDIKGKEITKKEEPNMLGINGREKERKEGM